MLKRLSLLLACIVLFCATAMTAYAQEVPDLTQRGSIEITMKKDDAVISGGSLTLYRIGEIQEEDGDYSFRLIGNFLQSGLSLEDIQSPELAVNLAEYADSTNGEKKDIDSQGYVAFTELEPGLYLLIQEDAAEGYVKLRPFLVKLPEWVNGTYLYQIQAGPKVEPVPEVTPTPIPTPTPTARPSGDNQPPAVTATPTPTPQPPTLPQTGQLNWPVPVMAVLGLWIFAMGWILRFGKKKDNE